MVLAPDVVFRLLDDEAVLLDLRSGTYFGLNPVGARIWQLLAEQTSLGTVLVTLQREYDVEPDALEHDLLTLVNELCVRGLGELKRP